MQHESMCLPGLASTLRFEENIIVSAMRMRANFSIVRVWRREKIETKKIIILSNLDCNFKVFTALVQG